MKVLIACECSGVVRRAFRAKGHDAWSCDLLPSADKSEYHYRCDVLRAIRWDNWDLLIAHPPCDYLATCAAWAFRDPDYTKYPGVGYHQKVKPGTLTGQARREAREKAVEFFLALWAAPVPRICIENPIGHMNTHPALPNKLPGRQIIQPYQFGEDASKATCLWLKGLPPLKIDPAKHYPPRAVCPCGTTGTGETARYMFSKGCLACGGEPGLIRPRWSNQTDSGQNRLSPSDDRASVRAVTYSGIALAMAEQWNF